ncbi:MAG: hypothetical protein HQL11_01855 [Candidatus Omnitrophica bacterium]|nr:hypothetical protein [Candidatus Omnitrophota bacterium]
MTARSISPQRTGTPLFPVLCAMALACLAASPAVHAGDPDSTDTAHTEKRLLFNQYFEDQVLGAGAGFPRKEKLIPGIGLLDLSALNLKAGVYGGYENNPYLDSSRDGDTFHAETIEGVWAFPHDGFAGILGEGRWGLGLETEFRDYSDAQTLDYHFTTLKTDFSSELGGGFAFDAAYRFNLVRYIRNNQLDYRSHELEGGLSVTGSNTLAHRVYGITEFKRYRDRSSLADSGLDTDTVREDTLFSAGYEFRWSPSEDLVIGVTPVFSRNNSNDSFHDYNDYEAAGLHAYGYVELSDALNWIPAGGYERTGYDHRPPVRGSDQTERDNLFYVGSFLYYEFREDAQIAFTYLYTQNSSNDRSKDYSDSVFTLGLEYRI